MERKYVIAYDIRDEKRLIKVAKTMESYGVRVQKSIFEAALTEQKLRTLKSTLIKIIDPEWDGIMFFLFCPKCEQKMNIIGKGYQTDLFQTVMII